MFTVKILSPELTECTDEKYKLFDRALQNELYKYTNNIKFLKDKIFLFNENLDNNCAVIVYNNSNELSYEEEIKEFLTDAKKNNAKIYPVAMNKEYRKPSKLIEEINSFDIYEQLRKRGLSEEYMEVGLEYIGLELARSIICDMQPILAQKNMNWFLSHRRTDGEEIVAEVDFILKAWGNKSFRDLNDIKAGENAQEIIETRLRESDTVIFFDTADVSNSPWVKKEIETAQLFNIPIVWVKMHNGNSSIKPANEPHIPLNKNFIELTEIEKNKFIDDIYQKAFDLHRMNIEKILGYVSSLKKLKDRGEIDFKQVDIAKNIYEVKIKRNVKRYREVPLRHFVQFFGRRPNMSDINALNKEFFKRHFNCNNSCDGGCDIAVLAGPFSDINASVDNSESVIVDGVQEYVGEVRRLIFNRKIRDKKSRNIIISGAFPENIDTVYQQRLIDAVSTLSKIIFDRGCSIIFGSHPTFTPLIMKMGEDRLGGARKEKIKMYMSRFFQNMNSEEVLNEYKRNTSFVMTETDTDMEKSLTKMREAMIKSSNASALLVIGGKTAHNGHTPGIDEEIKLAKEADIPVFIIGSAGGRAYEVAAEYNKCEWKIGNWIPNGLQPSENEKLLISTDFEELADMILTSLGI